MSKQSAGILVYKKVAGDIFVLLAHPGGPYWKNKDLGSWSIPKGEFTEEEEAFDAALREFEEETGVKLQGDFAELEPVQLKSGKSVYAWLHERDLDARSLVSNTFDIEWPPKSGRRKSFPEIDRFEWFPIEEAKEKINSGQKGFITQLSSLIL